MSHFNWANVFSLTAVAVRMEQLNDVVTRVKAGDLDGSRLVQATQVMTYAVRWASSAIRIWLGTRRRRRTCEHSGGSQTWRSPSPSLAGFAAS